MRVVLGFPGPVLGALVAVAILALAAAAPPAAPVATASPVDRSSAADSVYYLRITATDTYGYQPDTIPNLPLNTMINVTFIDDTSLPHSFNISSREGVEIVDYTDTSATELNQILFSGPALYATYVSGLGAESVGAFLSPTTPGWFEFVCNVSGHFQLGMFGYLAFGEGLPTNLTLPPGTGGAGVPTFPLVEAIVVLAVVLGVLATVLLRLRRIARDRAMEEADRASPILPRPPPPP